MEYQEIDYWLIKQGITESFGEIINPLFWTSDEEKSMGAKVMDLLLQGFQQKKEPFITLFAICVLFGVLSQVAIAFERKELKTYGYFLHYVCCAGICLRLFMEAYELVYEIVHILLSFMKVLTPTYCFSLLCSSGTVKSSTSYGLLILATFIVQFAILMIFLPAIKFLMGIQFANAATGQKLLGKAGQFLEDGISVALKAMIGMISGWQVVKSLLIPSGADTGNGMQFLLSVIPGVGQVTSGTMKLFHGAANVMKNCIGAGGIIVLSILAIPPIITLIVYVLGFKLLEAILQPMVQEQMTTLFSGCSSCMSLLLKTVVSAYLLLTISLCILTTLS